MRTMINETTGEKLDIELHVIITNGWEFYMESLDSDGIANSVVYGDEIEVGPVWMYSISPYAISITRDLCDLEPAPSWKWLDNDE